MRYLVTLAVVALCFFVGSTGSAQTAKQFAKELSLCQKLMDRKNHERATKKILETLEAHRDQDYVKEKIEDVKRLLGECAFATRVAPVALGDLIAGEVLSYKEKTGEIELRYAPGSPRAWETPTSFGAAPQPVKVPESLKDWEPIREEEGLPRILRHPAKFVGPYVVELVGRYEGNARMTSMRSEKKDDFRLIAPSIFSFFPGSPPYEYRLRPAYTAAPRPSFSFQIRRWDAGIWTNLAFKNLTNFKARKETYKIKISVSKSAMTLSHDGKKVAQSRKPKGKYGNVGLFHPDRLEEIVLRGKIDPAWPDGILRKETERRRADFFATYDVNDDLPAWLRSDARN